MSDSGQEKGFDSNKQLNTKKTVTRKQSNSIALAIVFLAFALRYEREKAVSPRLQYQKES